MFRKYQLKTTGRSRRPTTVTTQVRLRWRQRESWRAQYAVNYEPGLVVEAHYGTLVVGIYAVQSSDLVKSPWFETRDGAALLDEVLTLKDAIICACDYLLRNHADA